MKLFVTSNQQFGRLGAIKQYNRDFGSVEQMDEYMIQQWNSVVSNDDLVYVVGNFAWDPESAETAIKHLNGTIIIMDGKWDRASKELVNKLGSQLGIAYTEEGVKYIKDLNVALSYWPLSDWPHKDEGAISVVGIPKAHFNTNHEIKRVNAAVDYWDFKPVDIKQIITLFSDPDLAS